MGRIFWRRQAGDRQRYHPGGLENLVDLQFIGWDGWAGLENLEWSLSLASMLTPLPPDNFGGEGLGVGNLAMTVL